MRWLHLLTGAVLFVLGHTACAKEDNEGLDSGNSASASSASCENRCGGASEDESCWCDPTCGTAGDCCADFESTCGPSGEGATGGAGGWASGGSGGNTSGGAGGGTSGSGGMPSGGAPGMGGFGAGGGTGLASCKNACGGSSPDQSCYCNPDCQTYGDCCPDFATVCGGGTPAGGCTPELCFSDAPTAEGCYCDPSCAEYNDCCPNVLQVCGP